MKCINHVIKPTPNGLLYEVFLRCLPIIESSALTAEDAETQILQDIYEYSEVDEDEECD